MSDERAARCADSGASQDVEKSAPPGHTAMSDELAARRARHHSALRLNDGSWQCECGKDAGQCRVDLAGELEQEHQARQAAEARAEQAERDRDRAVDTVRALLARFTWHQSAAQSCTAGYHEARISGQEFEDIVQDLDNCGRTRLEVEHARAERLRAALALIEQCDIGPCATPEDPCTNCAPCLARQALAEERDG